VGRILRAVRHQRRLRQVDVAASADVSQSTVSRAEHGRLDRVSIEQLDAIARVLRVSLYLDARWLDGDADRLVDRDHAALVELVVGTLRRLGWDVVLEYGFNHFGDRGSVDVLGWQGPTAALLIVEVKSRVTDLQATLSAFERKVRIVPGAVAKDPGWRARHLGRLLVMPGTKMNRGLVARHSSIFDVAFPERMPELRTWLRAPNGGMGGIWFVSDMPGRTRKHVLRVRSGRKRA
jgi:transcriptional regulator with XRE-family HTH domain